MDVIKEENIHFAICYIRFSHPFKEQNRFIVKCIALKSIFLEFRRKECRGFWSVTRFHVRYFHGRLLAITWPRSIDGGYHVLVSDLTKRKCSKYPWMVHEPPRYAVWNWFTQGGLTFRAYGGWQTHVPAARGTVGTSVPFTVPMYTAGKVTGGVRQPHSFHGALGSSAPTILTPRVGPSGTVQGLAAPCSPLTWVPSGTTEFG